jgi:hypothetical protein
MAVGALSGLMDVEHHAITRAFPSQCALGYKAAQQFAMTLRRHA